MNQLIKKSLWAILVLGFACQPAKEKPVQEIPAVVDYTRIYLGTWQARWNTTPEAFPDVKDSELTMDGVFSFTEDSLSVTLYGYPGCLFSHDTLSNRSGWTLSEHTLSLINDDNTPSISYEVQSQDSTRIELVFLEDISVTLTR